MADGKMQTFNGRTEDAEAPFLGADFWKPETAISGIVDRKWETSNGPAYIVTLKRPVQVKLGGPDEPRISIGNLTGFRMAMDAAGLKSLLPGDDILLVCSGVQSAKKPGDSPRANFILKVSRKPQAADSDDPFYS